MKIVHIIDTGILGSFWYEKLKTIPTVVNLCNWGGRPQNRWEDYVLRWYKEMGIPMTDVNNWVKERRPIVYPLDSDGSRVRLK